jgi:hypothetical protein
MVSAGHQAGCLETRQATGLSYRPFPSRALVNRHAFGLRGLSMHCDLAQHGELPSRGFCGLPRVGWIEIKTLTPYCWCSTVVEDHRVLGSLSASAWSAQGGSRGVAWGCSTCDCRAVTMRVCGFPLWFLERTRRLVSIR